MSYYEKWKTKNAAIVVLARKRRILEWAVPAQWQLTPTTLLFVSRRIERP